MAESLYYDNGVDWKVKTDLPLKFCAFPSGLYLHIRISIFPSFETGLYCVVRVELELAILLPQVSDYWDYEHVPPDLSSRMSVPLVSGSYESFRDMSGPSYLGYNVFENRDGISKYERNI